MTFPDTTFTTGTTITSNWLNAVNDVCVDTEGFVSVLSFGAVGNGTTDDSAAFNAANASLAGAIYVPEGTYILDGVTINGKKLFGPGTLKWKSGVVGTTPMLTLASGACLDGLTLDGNKTANASIVATFSTLVYVTGRGTRITNCNFFQVPSTCVLTPASSDGETGSDLFIDGCYIKNTNKYCFVFRSNRCNISNCTFFGTGINDGHAIRYGIYNTDNIAFPGCKVVGGSVIGCNFKYVNSGACLFEWNSYNITFTGNSSSYTTGIKCEYQPGEESHGIVITGNYFEYCRFYPIIYNEATETATLGTNANSRFAIAGFNCSFSNNVMFEGPGIFLGNGSVAVGNLLKDCGTAALGSLIATSENGSVAGFHSNTVLPRPTDNPATIVALSSGSAIGNNIKGVAGQTTYGFNVQNTNNIVMGNHVDTSTYAFRTISTVTNSFFTGNTFANISGQAYFPNNGTETLVIDNPGSPNLYVPNQTISSGIVTIDGGFKRLRVDTEGAAATDDLNTISGGYIGQYLTLNQTANSRDVTVKTGTGNISLTGGDFTIGTTTRTITLFYDGSTWNEVARTA